MNFLLNILFFSAAVFIVANIMPTIRIKSYWTAVVVALVYSVVNFLVGWLLTVLAFPAPLAFPAFPAPLYKV